MSTSDIFNYIKVNDQIITGGQPTADQLRDAAADGFVTVINLATISSQYSLPDEAGLVDSLGMTYFHIPVDWDNPMERDFFAFEERMTHLPPGKVLIHCAANYRVTAFYSLFAQKHLAWSGEQASQFRAQIWSGSSYPAWDEFIARIERALPGK